ncbi:hydroxyethylthiazole kinase [Desulforegula conservatrix]|uniref:hydroxyethylthiazole kinase n=1 Tax=Desulforegula conservatrix TaxID=153026 RepID=UPI0004224C0F|nr:hydroxyethylthiazole kinase [Desulforegula conservatrix]
MKKLANQLLQKIKSEKPLIHNITNFVVMNHTANILLAIGASPVMAHSMKEVEEMASIAGALVLNIGTLEDDWVNSMICAGKAANKKGIPVVLDPVGSGATALRTDSVKRIMSELNISVLRGNASEIFSLSTSDIKTRGVDSSLLVSDEIIESGKKLAKEKNCIIAISGEEDFITDGNRSFSVKNGHPLMTKVTGTGCGLTAVIAAFCSVAGRDLLEPTVAAFGFYGLCAEISAGVSEKPGSFSVAFIDTIYSAGEREIDSLLKAMVL